MVGGSSNSTDNIGPLDWIRNRRVQLPTMNREDCHKFQVKSPLDQSREKL